MVERIRMVGVDKIFYGSDAATPTNMKPREAWAAFRALPLTEAEHKASRKTSRPICAESAGAG